MKIIKVSTIMALENEIAEETRDVHAFLEAELWSAFNCDFWYHFTIQVKQFYFNHEY